MLIVNIMTSDDDTKIGRPVKNLDDARMLQDDLNR